MISKVSQTFQGLSFIFFEVGEYPLFAKLLCPSRTSLQCRAAIEIHDIIYHNMFRDDCQNIVKYPVCILCNNFFSRGRVSRYTTVRKVSSKGIWKHLKVLHLHQCQHQAHVYTNNYFNKSYLNIRYILLIIVGQNTCIFLEAYQFRQSRPVLHLKRDECVMCIASADKGVTSPERKGGISLCIAYEAPLRLFQT